MNRELIQSSRQKGTHSNSRHSLQSTLVTGKCSSSINTLLFEDDGNKNIPNDTDGEENHKRKMYIENFREIFGIFNWTCKYLAFLKQERKASRREEDEIMQHQINRRQVRCRVIKQWKQSLSCMASHYLFLIHMK